MIKIRLNELLEERGQTLYGLAKQTRVRYATLWQMSRDEVSLLNLKTLEAVCAALNVKPGDLLVVQKPKRKRG
ncbi:MAG: helix-turn-helix domain-containing protein, partial [Pyrinomonadaceae bacterium]